MLHTIPAQLQLLVQTARNLEILLIHYSTADPPQPALLVVGKRLLGNFATNTFTQQGVPAKYSYLTVNLAKWITPAGSLWSSNKHRIHLHGQQDWALAVHGPSKLNFLGKTGTAACSCPKLCPTNLSQPMGKPSNSTNWTWGTGRTSKREPQKALPDAQEAACHWESMMLVTPSQHPHTALCTGSGRQNHPSSGQLWHCSATFERYYVKKKKRYILELMLRDSISPFLPAARGFQLACTPQHLLRH